MDFPPLGCSEYIASSDMLMSFGIGIGQDFENNCEEKRRTVDGLEQSNRKLMRSMFWLEDSHEVHVLAVDDSLIDRKVIERLLKISACKVAAVDSGIRALQFLGLDE